MCRIASLATDLNYLFFASLRGDVRSGNLKEFLDEYNNSFHNITKKHDEISPPLFTREELLIEYRMKNLWGLVGGLMIVPLVTLDSQDSPDISNLTDEEFKKYAQEKNEKSLKMIDSNQLFRSRFLSIIDDLILGGIIHKNS